MIATVTVLDNLRYLPEATPDMKREVWDTLTALINDGVRYDDSAYWGPIEAAFVEFRKEWETVE